MKKRIGVYICECGSNISDHVDVEKVMEAVRDEEGVALAKITMFACADSTQQEIVRDIEEMELDGLVIASCSPKLHLYTFRSVAERAGLNKYNYVQANIREQGSWAHSDKPREATEKAIRSVKAAIARTKLSQSLVPPVISSENSVLVVGAGIAGMRAAVELADTGSRVYLIDRSPFVGGRTAQWGELFPTDERGGSVVEGLFDEVMAHDGIELYTGCEVMSKTGSVGDFDIKLRISPRGFKVEPGIEYTGEFEKRFEKSVDACPVMIDDDFNFGLTERKAIYRNEGGLPWIPVIDQENCNRCGECVKICPEIELDQEEEIKEIKVGGVVIATGFDPYEPGKGEFGYGEIENVITLQQFRRLMEITGTRLVHGGKEVRNIAYIYCVGSRQMGALDGENKYCSRYCCTSAIHSALLAKKKFENIQNYHFTRGVRTYGKQEIIYEESSAIGDIYLQSFEDDPPEVVSQNGKTTVKVRDVLTEEKELEIEAELVVLVTAMVPRSNDRIGEIFKAPTGRDKFYNEVHPKLKPVETVIDGVFLAGTSQGPKNITEAIQSSLSAVIKASSLIGKGEIELEPTLASIDGTKCEWCGKCLDACPYEAVYETEYEGKKVASVNESTCKGCGMCLPVCPVNAIQLIGFTDAEIVAMIDALAD